MSNDSIVEMHENSSTISCSLASIPLSSIQQMIYDIPFVNPSLSRHTQRFYPTPPACQSKKVPDPLNFPSYQKPALKDFVDIFTTKIRRTTKIF